MRTAWAADNARTGIACEPGCRRADGQTIGNSAQSQNGLERYSWLGNIRELENFIERAVIFSPGTTLDAPLHELTLTQQVCVPEPVTLRDAECAHIERILRESNGVIGAAAVRLELPRSALFDKMRRLGIGARPRTQHSNGAAAQSYDMTQSSQSDSVPAIRILERSICSGRCAPRLGETLRLGGG